MAAKSPTMMQMQTVFPNSQLQKPSMKKPVIIAVALALSGCDFPTIGNALGFCKDTIMFAAVSPDDRYIATVYQRDCGATTDLITFVNVRPSLTKFSGRGRDTVFAVEWGVPTGLFWTDSSELRVQCIGFPGNKIFKQEKTWQDVAITYEFYGQLKTEYCEDSLKTKIRSPDGRYTARIYVRHCGATNDPYTHVSLATTAGLFRGGKKVVFSAKGTHEVSIAWQDDKHLKVECLDCRDDKHCTRQGSWKDVIISY